MWSLPDLSRLNREAASEESKSLIERQVNGEVSVNCEVCGWRGDETPAEYVYPYYDIFSDDAKGVIGLCDEHDGSTGSPLEGYFTCEDCGKVFVENYTWELYYVIDDCEQVCINCARDRALAKPEAWIDTTAPAARALSFEDVQKAPHLFAVGQTPSAKGGEAHGLVFLGNAEFDSMDGHSIGGGGVAGLREIMRDAERQGYAKVTLILDAGYQFAVSIGVYARPLAA